MNRLWVRLSFAISSVLAISIILPLLTFALLSVTNIIDPVQLLQSNEEEQRGGIFEEVPEVLLFISGASLLIGIVAGILISRGISAPITQLVEGTHRIGRGELGHHVVIEAKSYELRELTNAFNKMSSDLQEAEQLRSHLMMDVSHELRTPLTVLEGNLRAAIDHVYALDEAEIANLYSQTRHLIQLVNDLHLLATAEAHRLPLNLTDIDVYVVAQEVVDNFMLLAEDKGIVLTLQSDSRLPTLKADTARLRQVLSNLVANALRYTPTAGRVHLRLTSEVDAFHIHIQDSGDGIASEHLPHLFDRFYRADKSRTRGTGGSGLGLAIVKALVEAHGGSITAVSPGLNQGSTFTITFPI